MTIASLEAILVVGAGVATRGAIARRFARDGYISSVAHRGAGKLEPLLKCIRDAGGQARGFGFGAGDDAAAQTFVSFVRREITPIEWLSSTSAPTRVSKWWTPPSASTARSGRWRRRIGRAIAIFRGTRAAVRGLAGRRYSCGEPDLPGACGRGLLGERVRLT